MEGMENDHNLFEGVAFAVPGDPHQESPLRFMQRFGCSAVEAIDRVAAGPAPDRLSSLAGQLMTAGIDGVVLFSGAGSVHLLERAGGLADPERFFSALADVRLLVAGPSAARVLERRGIRVPQVFDSLADWRPILDRISLLPELAGSRLAVESTVFDLPLRAGLESRGVSAEDLPLVCPAIPGVQAPQRPGAASRPKGPGGTPSGGVGWLSSLVDSADELASLAAWAGQDPRDRMRTIVFSRAGDLVELAQLLGFTAWPIASPHGPQAWTRTEALDMARRFW